MRRADLTLENFLRKQIAVARPLPSNLTENMKLLFLQNHTKIISKVQDYKNNSIQLSELL